MPYLLRRRIVQRLAALVLLALLPALGACRREPATPHGSIFPRGRLITSRQAVCVPDGRWIRRRGSRSFQGVAGVGCWLGDPAPRTLRFHFTPGTAEPFCLRVLWDDEVVFPPALVPVEWGERGGQTVEIPAGRRTPGPHNLVVERCPLEGDTAPPVVALRELAVDDGAGPPRPLGTRDARRDGFLADFLIYGVTGLGRRMHDGVLADGPGSFTVDVAGHGGETLRLEAANASRAEADFVVEAGAARRRARVPAGEERRLELELPEGARTLRLAASGAEDGAFLFGAPRLVAAHRREADRRAAGAARPRPSLILLITLDTTRRDALGVYGAPPEATPNLDAFARQATVFDHAVTTAPWTLPAHASMFTGLYPSQHRAGVQSRRLRRSSEPLAVRLRRAGYLTAGFAGGRLMDHGFGVGQGFATYSDPEGYRTPGKHLTRRALRFVERAPGEPVFLFVNYFDAHLPYEPHPSFAERLGEPAARKALPPGLWRQAAEGRPEAFDELAHGAGEVTPEARTWMRAAYLSEVAYVDLQVGLLIRGLKARGLWDDALVVVVADHGELLGEHGLISHSYRLLPELVDVPLLVKWPGQTEGRRDPRLVSVVDLFPTVLAAAGVDVPESEGFDLAAEPRRSVALLEEHAGRVHALSNEHMFLADHLWGLRQPRRRRVLWDGGERCARLAAGGVWTQVPCTPGGERILAAIQQRLGTPDQESARMAGALSQKDREALAALGYL